MERSPVGGISDSESFYSGNDIRGRRREKRRFALQRWNASTESFLSSNGFVIIFLTTYALAMVLMFSWGAREEFMYTQVPAMRWFIAIARGSGYLLNLNCGLIILLASRLTFTAIRETPLHLVVPFDKTFPQFHIIVGYVIAGAVCGHGLFHLIWIIGWNRWTGGLWGINMCVATGFVLALVFLLMLVTSIPSVRQKQFETFYIVHNFGAASFFVLLAFHGVYRGVPYTYKWILGPVAIYVADRLMRKAKIVNSELDIQEEDAILKGGDVVRVSIPKQFEYRAGQYAEIKVKSVSKSQWHRDWTESLKRNFEDRLKGNVTGPLHAHIRGPYGAPAQHVGDFERVVLISGGVGATPFCSICKELYETLFKVHGIQLELDLLKEEDSREHEECNNEIMTCVRKAYDEATFRTDYVQDEKNDDTSFSLRDLFIVTSELNDPKTPLKSPGALFESSAGIKSARETDHDVNPKSVESSGVEKLKRMGFSFLPKGSRIDGDTNGYNNQELSFAKHSTHMDRFEAFQAVRSNVLRSHRQSILNFSHTIAVNVATYMLMLLRLMIVAMASIFGSMGPMRFSFSASAVFRRRWITALDVFLGMVVLAIVVWSLVTEILTYQSAFFRMKRRCLELFVLVPLLCLSVTPGWHEVLTQDAERSFFSPLLHFAVVIPLTLIFLIVRLHRVIGSRVLLADYSSGSDFKHMRAIDFIWTIPHDNDDTWLREELEHLANGTHLRLYRYLTREKADNKHPKTGSRGLTTNYGRPDWEELFRTISERTPSNGKVGIFFCGPKGMSKAVREALMKVQVLSNLRGLYLGPAQGEIAGHHLSEGSLEKLRSRGSNIRFVFREENFG